MSNEYITLEQFVADHASQQMLPYISSLELSQPVTIGQNTFFSLLVGNTFEASITDPLNGSYVNSLFCRYIYPKYRKMAISYKGENDAETGELTKGWMIHLINRIVTTYDEFKLLIDTFEAEKGNLMDGIKTRTQSKYNAVPQVYTSAGEVTYNDNYNTSVTTNFGEAEGASKIARIHEIETLIRNYYQKWSDIVCGGMFFYE